MVGCKLLHVCTVSLCTHFVHDECEYTAVLCMILYKLCTISPFNIYSFLSCTICTWMYICCAFMVWWPGIHNHDI